MMLAFLRAYGVQIGIALAILAALWAVDRRGYDRAADHFKLQMAAEQLADQALADRIHRDLVDGLAANDRTNADRLEAIARTRAAVAPTIAKEIANDPRYSSPACSVSGGVLRAINQARAAGGDPAAGSAGSGSMPAGAAAH